MPSEKHGHEYLPAHASPAFAPILAPKAHTPSRSISDFHLTHDSERSNHDPPPALISPAFTPPATPGTGTPAIERDAKSVLVSPSDNVGPGPKLLERLPEVRCEVRARIPTTTGQEMFLYLYKNDVDSKEHLAIVFGSHIRSKSLDAVRPGETERDRMIRGAYVGRLHPGRTSSRIEQIRNEAGVGHVSRPGRAPEQEVPQVNGKIGVSDSSSTAENAEEPDTTTPSKTTPTPHQSPLIRIHSECYTGETVWSARCDCGEQLDEAARLMALPSNKSGGCIIYLRQEGRGIGLGEKLKAYNLQDLGHDTYEANLLLRHPADARSYGLATAMLVDLGLGGEDGVRLLTNNPEKVRAVEGPGREVVVKERVAMVPIAWQTGGERGVKGDDVEKYLSTKIEKFKHLIG